MNVGKIFAGKPRLLLFALAAAIQIGLIAAMVYDRVQILRNGVEVTLKARPVDPRDLLRGDYVVLRYDISDLPAGTLADKPADGRGSTVYVKLMRKPDGASEAISVHTEPVPVGDGEALVQGRVTGGTNCGVSRKEFCRNLQIKYGLERYFVPQGEGREIEAARNQDKVSIVAAVAPSGRVAIKRLLMDGKPVYDEPLF
jgi:uncharacterized membrane-anchored protein